MANKEIPKEVIRVYKKVIVENRSPSFSAFEDFCNFVKSTHFDFFSEPTMDLRDSNYLKDLIDRNEYQVNGCLTLRSYEEKVLGLKVGAIKWIEEICQSSKHWTEIKMMIEKLQLDLGSLTIHREITFHGESKLPNGDRILPDILELLSWSYTNIINKYNTSNGNAIKEVKDYISSLLPELKDIKPLTKVPTAKERIIPTFTSDLYDRDPTKLTALCNLLKSNGFLDGSTKSNNFSKLFSGLPLDYPLIWLGKRNELVFFIKFLMNKKVIHNVLGKWKITSAWITGPEKFKFDSFELRGDTEPADNRLKKLLESFIF